MPAAMITNTGSLTANPSFPWDSGLMLPWDQKIIPDEEMSASGSPVSGGFRPPCHASAFSDSRTDPEERRTVCAPEAVGRRRHRIRPHGGFNGREGFPDVPEPRGTGASPAHRRQIQPAVPGAQRAGDVPVTPHGTAAGAGIQNLCRALFWWNQRQSRLDRG